MLHTLRFDMPRMADGVLRAMFAARKSVFVDLLKWDVPVLEGLYEVDQFDDENATYLVLAEADGRHLGSARLLPTCRPHILSSFYAELCAEDPPRSPDVVEITRFCLDRGLAARDRRLVRDTLVHALVDHALANGIAAYCAIAEMGWYQQILAFGWRCTPLGLPRTIDGAMLAALRIDISHETPALLAAAGIVPVPTIRGDARAAA